MERPLRFGFSIIAASLVLTGSLVQFTSVNAQTLVESLGVKTEITVNADTNTVFVTNPFKNTLKIIDGTSGFEKVVVRLNFIPGGLAVNRNTNVVYVTDPVDNELVIFDGSTGEVLSDIAVGSRPRGVEVDPSTNRIFVANSADHSISVIDGVTKQSYQVALTDDPRDLAFDEGTKTLYVTSPSANKVFVIPNNAVYLIPSVAVGTLPDAVAANPITGKTYVVHRSGNFFYAIDGDRNLSPKVTFECLAGGAKDVTVDPVANKIYVVSAFSPYVCAIDGVTHLTSRFLFSKDVSGSPVGIAVNSETGVLYVADGPRDTVFVVDGNVHSVSTRVAVGANPVAVTVNPATNKVYVANKADNTIHVINGTTNGRIGLIQLNGSPIALAAYPAANRIYAVTTSNSSLTLIEGESDIVVRSLEIGSDLVDLAVNQITGNVYAIDKATSTLYIVSGDASQVLGARPLTAAPTSIEVDSVRYLIYIASESTNGLVVMSEEGTVMSNLSLSSPTDMVIDDATYSVYVGSRIDTRLSVSVIDETRRKDFIRLDRGVVDLAINTSSRMLYATHAGGLVSVTSLAYDELLATIKIGANLADMAVNPAENKVYAVLPDSNSLAVIEEKVRLFRGIQESVSLQEGRAVLQNDKSVDSLSRLGDHPERRFEIRSVNVGATGQPVVGQEHDIEISVKDNAVSAADHVYIVQIVGPEGDTVLVDVISGKSAAYSAILSSWTPQMPGAYTVKVFIWDGVIGIPTPLSQGAERQVHVAT